MNGKATPYRVVPFAWGSDAAKQAVAIRFAVFVDEQRVPAEEEIDAIDDIAYHVIAFDGDEPVATGRLFDGDAEKKLGKIGRMAVLKSHRGSGAGSTIIRALMEEAVRRDYGELALSAQLHAIPFYERHGFSAYGDAYDDAGIPHRMMKKRLSPSRAT
ncbi:GNAT family N-acetyltransferase [Candidatus Sumerlaeota bacterium]|nr:GNAT family N-acetyltransferase [Candidatus Sumerlaeota bacterium]